MRTKSNTPRSYRPFLESLESRLVPTVFNLHQADSLQNYLNMANPGDTLMLDAGASFGPDQPGSPIILPYKTPVEGNPTITIESSNLADLPGSGVRVSPTDAVNMPRILTECLDTPALVTEDGAHDYTFIGVEVTSASASYRVDSDLISIGNVNESTLQAIPSNITFDRCYVHGLPGETITHGIEFEARNSSIINCYTSDITSGDKDAQAILTMNSPGPLNISNNWLEASGENFMAGGNQDASTPFIPSNITFTNNDCIKPLEWDPYDPVGSWRNGHNYDGSNWVVKNDFELKDVNGITIDSNRFEYCWVGGQNGTAILFQGGQPEVWNVTFTNNIIAHATNGIDLVGSEFDFPSPQYVPQQLTNATIGNNLFDDIGNTGHYGSAGSPTHDVLLTSGNAGGTINVTIDHNTFTTPDSNGPYSNSVLVELSGQHVGFVFQNNIGPLGTYGVLDADNGCEGTAALSIACPSGYTFSNNVMWGSEAADYPPNNSNPPDFQTIPQGSLPLLAGTPPALEASGTSRPTVTASETRDAKDHLFSIQASRRQLLEPLDWLSAGEQDLLAGNLLG